MKSGTRRFLSGVVAAALAAALSIPAVAAENHEIGFNHGQSGQNGASMIEIVNSLDTDQPVPSLGMTPAQAVTRYHELKRESDATGDAAEKARIEKERETIKAALEEAYPGVDLGLSERSPKEPEPVNEYETPVGVCIEYFYDNGMSLMFSLSDSSERTTLTEEEVTTFLGKLKELEGLLPSASSTQLERAKSTMQSFRDIVLMYKNSETLVAAVNAFLSRLELPGQRTEPGATTPFTDVPADAWYAQDVADVQELGIIQGKGNGLFDPDGPLTIAEAITLAAKTRAYYNGETIPAVEGGAWYSGAEAYATAQGVIQDSFPYMRTGNAHRTQMAYLFANALPASEYPAINDVAALPDVTETGWHSTQFSEQIFRLYDAGILTGSDEFGSFRPYSDITRAEAAAILNRLVHPEKRVVKQFASFEGDAYLGGYVNTSPGSAQRMLKSAYSRQYELEALDSVRFGEDATGVYVTFTAPELPAEIRDYFTFTFDADVCKSNWDYFATNAHETGIKPGESRKIYFYSFASEGTRGITSSQVDIATVGVFLTNPYGEYMFIRKIDSTDQAHAYGVWYDDAQDDVLDYDSSAIFAGIGK